MKQPNQVKEEVQTELEDIRELSSRLTDTNAKKENTHAVLLVGLTEKDFDALQKCAAQYPKIKNYGVLVRRVIRQAAKNGPDD